ncbi:MAG: 5'/3'-nucleotidase SurE [Candidatus Heimdallarchaeota archaeon]|nr:5'/3'-nucleotidase SurE [Candidatus Heimdallarchaeota archaeon]
MKVMISNDDGIRSMGIDALSREAQTLGETYILAPDRQQTARAKAMTFHKPIRVTETKTISGLEAQSYDSAPADAVILFSHFHDEPDVVLSGINSGDNTSIHSILTSGTAAVAMEAGMKGIPSFAYSLDVSDEFFYSNEIPGELERAAKLSIIIAKHFLQASEAFWEDTLFINVNYPKTLNAKTKVEFGELETYKYNNYVVDRLDPSGRTYFWMWGDKRETFNEEGDSYKLYKKQVVTITPVSFRQSHNRDKTIKECVEIINKINESL